MERTIAMIGAGNMARALIGGLIERGHPADRLVAADADAEVRARIERDFGIESRADNAAAAADGDIVVLAVKPQVIDDVVESVAGALSDDAVVVSVAAGIPVARLARGLGEDRAIVRVMPNTPALHGVGATGLFAGDACTRSQQSAVRELFEAVGRVFHIDDERLMDAVTAVSGSGPAYFFAFAEALAEAGVRAGLDRDTAEGLAAQTAAGAGAMLADGSATASELRSRVTSPGGTTAAALTSLEQDRLADSVYNAVAAAVRRGRELGGSS